MKRCPTCSRVYDDISLRFCFDDGTELVNKLPEGGAPETQHMPGPHDTQSTIKFTPSPQPIPPIQPALKKRRRVWPWVVGGAGFVIVAIAVVTVAGFLRYLKKPLVDHLVLRVDYASEGRDERVTATMGALRKRLNEFGIRSYDVKAGAPGSGEILLALPRLEDPERVKKLITNRGRLHFTHVISEPDPQPILTFPSQEKAEEARIRSSDMPGYILPYVDNPNSKTQKWVLLEETPIISGADIRQASASPSAGDSNNYGVRFSLRRGPSDRFANWTADHNYEYLAVVLNNEVKSIVTVRSQISDYAVITGRYTRQEAEDLALVLNAGELPAPITIVSEKIDN
jgi:protein-export membrane protein SecD